MKTLSPPPPMRLQRCILVVLLCLYSVSIMAELPGTAGSTGVSNGQVNGSAGGVPTYVPSGYANLSVQLTGGSAGGSTNWYVATGSGSLSPDYNNCTVSWSGFVRVIVDASNRCGSGGSWTFYLTTQQGYYGYRTGPNPVKDKLSLLLDYEEMVGEVIQGITLYDSNNKAWYSSDVNQLKNRTGDKKVVDITTKGFPRGTYFLHVQYGMKGEKDAIVKSQVILE